MRTVTAALVVLLAFFSGSPARAGTVVTVPAGTKVLLKFLTPLDSSKAKEGDVVRLEVAADVLVDRYVIFRLGDPARGIVTDVSQPGIFGKNARVHISYIQATAVDGRPVRLAPLDVTPASLRQVTDVGAAGATSLTGAILLGPLGLAAGALIHGGHVTVPAGAVGTSSVAQTIHVAVP